MLPFTSDSFSTIQDVMQMSSGLVYTQHQTNNPISF